MPIDIFNMFGTVMNNLLIINTLADMLDLERDIMVHVMAAW